jgi:hypothetical protein
MFLIVLSVLRKCMKSASGGHKDESTDLDQKSTSCDEIYLNHVTHHGHQEMFGLYIPSDTAAWMRPKQSYSCWGLERKTLVRS